MGRKRKRRRWRDREMTAADCISVGSRVNFPHPRGRQRHFFSPAEPCGFPSAASCSRSLLAFLSCIFICPLPRSSLSIQLSHCRRRRRRRSLFYLFCRTESVGCGGPAPGAVPVHAVAVTRSAAAQSRAHTHGRKTSRAPTLNKTNTIYRTYLFFLKRFRFLHSGVHNVVFVTLITFLYNFGRCVPHTHTHQHKQTTSPRNKVAMRSVTPLTQ